jgi:hypothetical protein
MKRTFFATLLIFADGRTPRMEVERPLLQAEGNRACRQQRGRTGFRQELGYAAFM